MSFDELASENKVFLDIENPFGILKSKIGVPCEFTRNSI